MSEDTEWMIAFFIITFVLFPQVYILYWYALYRIFMSIISIFKLKKGEKDG